MEPMYCINFSLGCEENFLKVYSNHVEIRKPKVTSWSIHGPIDMIKKELRMQGILKGKYIGINVPFSDIDCVDVRKATGEILCNGMIIFHLKNRPKGEVNFFNYEKTANAFKFNSQSNETAQKIKNLIERAR